MHKVKCQRVTKTAPACSVNYLWSKCLFCQNKLCEWSLSLYSNFNLAKANSDPAPRLVKLAENFKTKTLKHMYISIEIKIAGGNNCLVAGWMH